MQTDESGRGGGELLAAARACQYDNQAPGDEGYCEAGEAIWVREVVDIGRVSAFASPEAAGAWLAGEIAMDESEGLGRGWRALLTEEIEEDVVLLERNGRLHVWDGWHRISASMYRGIPLKAIVGRPVNGVGCA